MSALPPLTAETLWAILNDELPDAVVNQLVWETLGYRYEPDTQTWNPEAVAEDWRDRYPTPPDFVASRPATVQLTRSIPPENKQLLKEVLGFKGYTVDQLVPRLTRRATMTNWLLSVMRQRGLI